MVTMTTMNDRAEPEFSLTRARVERLLAMLDVKRANGGLNADEAKAHEVATLRLFGAGETILATQHAVDLLRFKARELFW